MTPAEFKSWFGGFTEAMEDRPTDKQWTRIKERVAEIDGQPVTERHFIDRYWPTYVPSYIPAPVYRYPYRVQCSSSNGVSTGLNPLVSQNLRSQNLAYENYLSANQGSNLNSANVFNSSVALCDLGRKDYAELN